MVCFVTLNCLYPIAALWNMMGSCGKIPHQSCMHCNTFISMQCTACNARLSYFFHAQVKKYRVLRFLACFLLQSTVYWLKYLCRSFITIYIFQLCLSLQIFAFTVGSAGYRLLVKCLQRVGARVPVGSSFWLSF